MTSLRWYDNYDITITPIIFILPCLFPDMFVNGVVLGKYVAPTMMCVFDKVQSPIGKSLFTFCLPH